MFGKKGLTVGFIKTAIIAMILLVVMFQVYATLIPTAQEAGDELNASGAPLGNFFVSTGVIWLLIMAALVFVVITAFWPKGAGK